MMERFDNCKDITPRLFWHRDQESGTCVHPGMNEIEVAESIWRQFDSCHDHITFLSL